MKQNIFLYSKLHYHRRSL